MVQFLARFLDIAPVGEGGVDIDDVDPDDDQFLDIEELPHGPYDAIQALFELGITNGTSRTRFSPDRTVTRAQMAMFISRMLAHTNARPAGITMQAETTTVIHGDTVEMVVSVRDNRHQPTDDALVDLFSAESPQKAFNSNGTCTTKVTSEFGDQRCVIDFSDETTDEEGNIPYTVAIDEDLVLWAWTGDLGNRFDADREDVASLQFTAKKEAVDLLVTDDLHPEASMVPFGEWVTITFQAVDEDENPVAEKDVEVRILIVEKSDGRTRDRTNTYDTDSSGKLRDTVPPHRSRLALRRSGHSRPQHPEFGSGHQGRDGQERGDRRRAGMVGRRRRTLNPVGGAVDSLSLPVRLGPWTPQHGEGHVAGSVR